MTSRRWNSRSIGPNKCREFYDVLAREMGAPH